MTNDHTEYSRNARELAELVGPIRTVGLTGGIASGKTVASTVLARAGYNIVDADEISRRLTARGTKAEKDICALFPGVGKDGTLDRKRLRDVIASNVSDRRKLEEYTHPLIIAEIKKELSAGNKNVLAAPLLFETALARFCDCTVCVTCPKDLRIDRIAERDKVTREQAERIIDAQIPDLYRATLANFCVPSNTDKAAFESEIVALFDAIFGK